MISIFNFRVEHAGSASAAHRQPQAGSTALNMIQTRPEFNASFSSGFGNGLAAATDDARPVMITRMIMMRNVMIQVGAPGPGPASGARPAAAAVAAAAELLLVRSSRSPAVTAAKGKQHDAP